MFQENEFDRKFEKPLQAASSRARPIQSPTAAPRKLGADRPPSGVRAFDAMRTLLVLLALLVTCASAAWSTITVNSRTVHVYTP